jgi:hypothetical protein
LVNIPSFLVWASDEHLIFSRMNFSQTFSYPVYWSKDREAAISGAVVVEKGTLSPMRIRDSVPIADRLALVQ